MPITKIINATKAQIKIAVKEKLAITFMTMDIRISPLTKCNKLKVTCNWLN